MQPLANELRLKARLITAGEIQAAKTFFAGQFQDLAQRLQQELKDSVVEQSRLIQEMSAKSVSADVQSQILQSLRNADAAQTQILWSTATKDIAGGVSLYKQVALQQAIQSLGAKSGEGTLSADDVRKVRDALGAASLDTEKKNVAQDLLGQLESRVKTAAAILGAVPGQPTQTQNLPAGSAPIIFNPKLPAESAVALGNGYVMIGTGGRGEMELVTGDVATAMGLPVSDGTPAAPSSAEEPDEGVVLANSPDSGTTVYYTVLGNEYTMGPGYTHTLPYASVTVNFNRGGSFGRKEYTLSPGTYRFTGTDQGWELYAREYRVTIDNTGNPYEFHYVADNQRAVVGPGQTKEHKSKFPVLVRFDRGNGTAVKQVRGDQGVLKVAVNPQDGMWDLFSPAKVAGAAAAPAFTPAF